MEDGLAIWNQEQLCGDVGNKAEPMEEDNGLDLLETEDVGVVLENVDIKSVARHEEAGARKNIIRGNQVLKGVSTKKSNVQALISPRKKLVSKNSVRLGDRLYPAAATVSSEPIEGTGKEGGNIPPKPSSD